MRETRAPRHGKPVAAALAALMLLGAAGAQAATQTLGGDAVEGALKIECGATGMRVLAYLDGVWKPQTFSQNKSSMVHYEQGGTFWYTAGYYGGLAMTCTKNVNISATVNERIWTGHSVELTMRTTYASPSRTMSYEFEIKNTSGTALNSVKFFHGQDTYLGYSDAGGGYWDSGAGMVGVRKPSKDDPDRLIYQQMGGTNPRPDAYASASYHTVKRQVEAGALTGLLAPSYTVDNGYALQWNRGSLGPGETWTIQATERIAVGAGLSVELPSGEIGTAVTITGVVENAGDTTANGTLAATVNLAGWTATISGSTNISIPQGQTLNVPIHVTCPPVISVGDVATVTLRAITPDASVSASGSITAVYYDGVALVQGVTDDGAPSISQGTDFGGRLVGSVVTQQFRVYNAGVSNITLLTNSLVGSPRFTVSGIPETLAVGETQTFAVVYSATDYSVATATLTLDDHKPWAPFVMNLQGYGYVISPNNGPKAGGNLVTITNGTLGSGADISQVTVGGKNATMVDQGTDWVRFVVPAQASTGWKDVAITSLSGGKKTMRSCYLVNAAGSISKVTPDVGEGNEYVTISGRNLCNGDLSDITNVSFCGIAASDISISGTTQVVARTSAGGDGKGHVIVDSVSRGRTIAYNAFLYGGAEIKVLGIDDDVLADDAAANTLAGTDFGFVAVGAAGTRTFRLRNAQALPLKVSLVTTTGADEFSVVQWPTQVVQNVTQDVVVAFSPTSRVSRSASLYIYNSTTNSPFVVNLLAQGVDMAPLEGPVAGGTAVTITNFPRSVVGLVTNISLREVAGTITGQGTNWLSFTTPACVSTGWQDGAISGLADERPLLGSFHYNAPGTIVGVAPTSGVHSGGFSVTITGTNLCDGTVGDVRRVQLAGVDAAAVLSASATQIVVTAGAGLGGMGHVVVESAAYGRMVRSNAFTYTGGGGYTISTNWGSASGGNAVTLTFEDLGGGVNITNVLSNGQAATIVSQDGSSVTFLLPGAFWELTTVDITIQSEAHGQLTYEDAYTYRHHAWIGRPDCSSGYWTNMGAGLGPQSEDVKDIKFSPDGVLYAAGRFTRSGSDTSVKTLARWVNGQWQYVPSMTGWVNKIMFRGTNLYAAGSYLRPSGQPRGQLARLSGTTWTTHSWSNQTQNPYPGGYALAQDENYIYVSDYQYTTSPYNSSNQPRMFRFDETSGIFTAMPAINTSTTIYYALTFHEGALYAGGDTWWTGPRMADTNVQQWTGTAWVDTGPMLTDTNWGQRQVNALTVFQGDLYLGQRIQYAYLTNDTRVATNLLLRYDGTGWKHITGFLGQLYDGIRALDTDGHRLFVAGARVEHDPAPPSGRFSCIAHWDGSNWGSVGSQSLTVGTWYVSTILATPRGIYAGGKFPSIGTNAVHGGITRATNIAFFVFAQTNGLSVNAGPYAGGTQLTIHGHNLGNGTTDDVYRITVCGVDVASIDSVSSTQIVVTTAAGYPGLGDVTVYTHDYGPITQSNGFTYTGGSGLSLTGLDDGVITNGQPPGASAGTWWSRVPGGGATNTLTLVNSGSEALTISGVTTNGDGAAAFTCTWPGTLAAGDTGTVTVAFDPASPGVYTAAVVVANNSPSATAPFVLNLHGIAAEPSVNNGPGVGGNVITLTSGVIGDGSDISSVWIGLNAAEIVSQTATSVTVRLPPGDQPNVPYDIVVTSDSLGSFTLSNAYTYHPAGEIFEYAYDWTFWEQVQSLPAARFGLGAEVLNGSLYALAGSSGTDLYHRDVYRFDGTRWHEAPPFQDARAYFATAVFSNSIYGIAGINTTNSAAGFTLWTSYRYDGTNNYYTGNLWNKYRQIAGATLGDYIYAIGGQWTNNQAHNYNYRSPGYDWTLNSIPTLPANRMRGAAATLNDAIYYSGGAGTGSSTINTNVYRFDGTSWTQVRGLPRNIAGHAAAVLDGKMYCIGGYAAGGVRYTNVVAFDGTNWTEMAGLPVPRYDLAAATYDGRIYAIGGRTTAAAQREVYRYPARFNVPGVTPSFGNVAGGTVVVIPGTNLCIGADVTHVTLCGVSADEIIEATPTQVIVRTSAALELGIGDVVVYSTSIGETRRADAFTYVGPYSVLGTGGAAVPSGAAASSENGTAFPSTGGGAALTNVFSITNHTESAITITSMSFTGTQASAFSTPESGGFTVDAGAVSNFSVAFNPFAGGSLAASLVIESASSGSYLVNLSGTAWALSSASGSSEGGVSVTITNGAVLGYGDITAVFVDGIEVAPTAQGETWVTFTMPAHEEGAVDIVVSSTSIGDTGLANAYTYMPPSEIYGDDLVWTELPGLPQALYAHTPFVLNDQLYVAGGMNASYENVTNLYRFDGQRWHEEPGLPQARSIGMGAVLDGAFYYMGGGAGGTSVTNVYRFNGTTWTETAGLTIAVGAGVAGVVDGQIVVAGGWDATGTYLTNAYRFDGTTWTAIAGLPAARAEQGGAVRRGKLYAFGGRNSSSAATFNQYSFNGTAWTTEAGMPALRFGMGGATLNNRVYSFGGSDGTDVQDAVSRYDGIDWSDVATLPTNLYAPAAMFWRGAIYVAGGMDATIPLHTNLWRLTDGGIAPISGYPAGGYEVTIRGTNLCNGTMEDVDSVTLCGIPAEVISVSSTQIVVVAGASDGPVTGDVVVHSLTFGAITAENGFTYQRGAITLIGTNGVDIAESDPASAANGTDFGSMQVGSSRTNVFGIRNTGNAPITLLGIEGIGPGGGSFTATSFPTNELAIGATGQVTVVCASGGGDQIGQLAFLDSVYINPFAPEEGAYTASVHNVASYGVGTGLGLSQTSLTFNATYGGVAPAAQTFDVGNVGADPLTFSNVVAYAGFGETWLTVAPAGGALNPAASLTTTGSVSLAGLNAGTHTATIGVWSATATNSPQLVRATLVVAPVAQTLAWTNPGAQTYTNETLLDATASSGLAPTYTLISGPGTLTNISYRTHMTYTSTGIVTVSATQPGNLNYGASSSVTQSWEVTRAPGQIWLTNLVQEYTGGAISATVLTSPSGLAHSVTYDGNAWAPTNMGAYEVIATITDEFVYGSVTGTLEIVQGSQAIAFAPIPAQRTNDTVGLAATGGASGQPVTFAIGGGPGSIAGGTNLTFTGVGDVLVVASQAGDANFNAAPNVTNTVRVFSVTPDNGPFAGGNAVTITNGVLGTVTNVLVGNGAATPSSLGSSWVSLTMPAATNAGLTDITLQTEEYGDILLADAYTYNPQGVISGSSVTQAYIIGSGTLTNAASSSGYSPIVYYYYSSHYQFLYQSNDFATAGLTGPARITALGFDVVSDTQSKPLKSFLVRMKHSAADDMSGGMEGTDLTLCYSNSGYIATAGGFDMLALDTPFDWDGSSNVIVDTAFDRNADWCNCGQTTYDPIASRGSAYRTDSFDTRYDFTHGSTISVLPRIRILAEETSLPVTPSSGSWTGGYPVAIGGENLGNGGDITNVTLCGASATILSQTVDRVWIVAGKGLNAGVGDVVVQSTSHGETVGSNLFTYTGPGILVSSPGFGPAALGSVVTNFVVVTNPGTEAMVIAAATNHGPGAGMFDVTALVGLTVDPGTASNVPVTFAASTVGTFTPTAYTVNNGPNSNYYFGLYGSVFSASTNVGPYGGGNTITITNGHFGTITNVLLGATQVSPLQSGPNWFTITLPPATNAGAVDIIVQTSDNGDITLADAYTYNPAGEILDVAPVSGSWTGGYEVVIGGTNLGNGGDITNVTLCGVAASIVSQSATQVVVAAGAAGVAGAGDVVVQSTSFGTTVKSNGFTYTAPGLRVLGTNGAAIASGDAAQAASGTAFRPLLSGASWTNTFAITNNGTETVSLSGVGISDPRFEIAGMPATVAAGTASNFTVRFAPGAAGSYTGVLTITNTSPTAAYAVNLAGSCFSASMSAGPFAGGNEVTFTNGNFGTITNVLVGGVAATIVDSGASWVTVVMPSVGAAGAVDVEVQTSDNGDVVLAGAYAYNPAGAIFDPASIAVVDLSAAPLTSDYMHIGDLNGAGYISQTPTGDNRLVLSTIFTLPFELTKQNWNQTLLPQVVYSHNGVVNLDFGAEIDGAQNWEDIDSLFFDFYVWPDEFFKYFGFRFQFDSQSDYRYGWVQVRRDIFTFTVSRMAFTRVDGLTLRAGQTTTDVGGVSPNSGSFTGGYEVVISGANLCNGADLTSVTLAGVAVDSIVSQSATQIVVVAGAAGVGTIGTGDVVVQSTSFGTTVKSNGFNYLREAQAALVFEPASPQAYATTNALSVSGGSGTGVVSFAVASGPGTIFGGSNLVATAGGGDIVVVATKAQDGYYLGASATATVAAAKADQTITNFLPADGAQFVLNSATSVSAQASSGLAVAFENLTPEIASLTGFDIAFTNPGVASVRAYQAGDSNWNVTALTHEWRVGGMITNVTPGAANVGGGIDIVIQGIWLGDGANISTVRLAGVEAVIVTQGIHEVTVTAGVAPATVTGDVFVVSGTGGEIVLSNAFEYLWLDAPVQLDPVDITPSNLVARWELVAAAGRHVLDVGLDTNFAGYLPGYEKLDVALAEQYPVEGLAADTWYALRLFAWDVHGYSLPSRTVWVPATGNTPYEEHPLPEGPVSEGAVMERDLSLMFHGAGMVYTAESSDSNVVTVAVTPEGLLAIDPRGAGTAVITVTATDPLTGYSCSYSFEVQVVGAPALDSAVFLPRELWNPRFTQALQVRNDSGLDAIGVRVLFTNLMPGITVENRTGTAVDGRPMIEMQTAFSNGATLNLNVVYLCTGAFRADAHPPTIELQYILPEWVPPLPGEETVIGEGFLLQDGRFIIQFDSVAGRLYAVEYRNNFPGGEWVQVPLRLRATANRTQWIDAGPPATKPPEGLRVYRVKELAE